MNINESIPNLSMLYKDGSVYVTQKAIDRDYHINIPQEVWGPSGNPYPSNPSWIKCELLNYFKVDSDGFFYLTEADIYYHEFSLAGIVDSTQSKHDHPYHKFVLQFDFKIPSNPKDKYVLFFSDSYDRINPYDAYYLEKIGSTTWKISHHYRNSNNSYPIVEGEEVTLKADKVYRFKRVIYCGTDTGSIQVIKAFMNGKQVVRDITDFWGRGNIAMCDNFKVFVYNDRGLYLPCLKYNNVFITDEYVDYMGDDEWVYQEDSRKLSLTITSDKTNPIAYGDTVNLTTTVIDSKYQSESNNSIITPPSDFTTGDDTFNLPICNLTNPYGEVLETKTIHCAINSYYGGNWVEFPLIDDGSIYSGLRGIKTWSTQERSYGLTIKDNTNKDTLGCSDFAKFSHFIVEYTLKVTDSYNEILLGSFKLENPNDGSNLECIVINNKGELLDTYSQVLNSKIPYIERDKWYKVKFDFSLDTPTKDTVDIFYSTLNLYINDTLIYTHTYERNTGNTSGLTPQISWCIVDPYSRSYPGIITDLHITRVPRELSEYEYIWSTNETTPNITINEKGTYTCKVYVDSFINAIDFINIIYNEEFKNEYKPALPPYSKGYYLVCYKGNSILDKLIKIVKKHSPFFLDPTKELNQEIEQLYTHVGILVLPEDISDLPKEVTYLACREDAGVMEYTEPREDIDIYKINLETVDTEVIQYFFNRTQYLHGSMITDMGYRHLAHPGTLGSVDWVAMALNLAFPKKYTITRLIEFSQMKE